VVVRPDNQVRLARRYTLSFTHVLVHTQQLRKANRSSAVAVSNRAGADSLMDLCIGIG